MAEAAMVRCCVSAMAEQGVSMQKAEARIVSGERDSASKDMW